MREKLTQSDVKKIQQEIEHRKLVERKELIEAVKEARSHGDLSENFEYHAAKKEKNRNRKPDPLSGENVKDCSYCRGPFRCR